MRKIRMTQIPPLGKPAEWYHPAQLCRLCRAKVLNRVEGDVPQLRVLHEDTCTSSPEKAIEVVGSRRGVDRAGEAVRRGTASRRLPTATA